MNGKNLIIIEALTPVLRNVDAIRIAVLIFKPVKQNLNHENNQTKYRENTTRLSKPPVCVYHVTVSIALSII